MKKIVMVLSILLILGGLGCAALSELITPAEIDRKAVCYAEDRGVAEPNEFDGYPNLAKAKKLGQYVESAYAVKMQEIEQAAETEELKHSIHAKTTRINTQAGIQREDMLFGETGLLSLGLSMLGAGGFAGFLGLMRKRPGDITKEEYETAVASAGGKTSDELTTKQRQFAQLISGIGKFVETLPPPLVAQFKSTMNEHQDTDTQIAVAAVKKS